MTPSQKATIKREETDKKQTKKRQKFLPFFVFQLSSFKDEMDTHVLNEFANRLDAQGLIFLCDMPVEADGKAHARLFHDFLLGFVFQKLVHVIVALEIMQAVVVYVHFPEDTLRRHTFEIAIGVFADRIDKTEKIGMGNPDGAAAAFCKRENISVRNRHGMIEVFYEREIEEGYVRTGRQGVAVLGFERADLDAAKNLDLVTVLFTHRAHMIVIPRQGLAVVRIQFCTLIPTKFLARATHAVVVVADPKLLYAACNRRFHDPFGGVVAAKGIVGVCV